MCKKNILKPRLPLLLLLLIWMPGCAELGFFEKDLGNAQVILNSPPDSTQTMVATQTFWWEEVTGATKYRLQIVHPNFNAPLQLVLDTTINEFIYSYTLIPGKTYQWRVRAENESSETPYTTRTIFVNDTSDLSQQIVLVQSPTDNACLGYLNNINFQWQGLSQADSYTFIIEKNGIVIHQETLTTTTKIFSLNAEGNYEWKVRAENSSSVTPYFQRNLSIDTTPPNPPLLLLPVNNDTITTSFINFTWSRGTETGCNITDKVYIYSDSVFVNQVDVITVSTPGLSYVNNLSSGFYFWRVQSTDLAGNISYFSTKRRIYIQ
jgi:hypothetical protein